MLAGKLKEKLRKRELTVGSWMIFDFYAGYLEIYKKAGVDYVVLDMEHGSVGLSETEVIDANMQVIKGARKLDKPCGFPVGSIDEARFWQERGCDTFIYDEATSFASQGARRFVEEIRGTGR